MAAVKTAQYIFFGALGGGIAGLLDVWMGLSNCAEPIPTAGIVAASLIGAAALVPFGALLGLLAALLGRRLSLIAGLSKLRRPRNAALVTAAVLLSACTAVYLGYRRGILIDAVDFRPLCLSFLMVAIVTAGSFVPMQKTGFFSKETVPAVFIALSLGILIAALTKVSDARNAPRVLSEKTALLKPLFNGIKSIFDRDADGFSTVLCSADCDCNDGDPKKNPAATDIPGNGVDEDCSLQDLKLPAKREAAQETVEESSAAYPSAFSPPMNIVLITVDALRADRMHVYGHDRNTTPMLDRFAAKNVRFAEVRSQGSSTRHVFPVLLTGRYFPTIHQDKGKKWWTLLNDNITFAEILKNKGYRTVAVLPYFRFKEHSGFQQGFDVWEPILDSDRDSTWEPTGDLVTRRGIEHLDALSKSKEPWLLWLHYFDPHASYVRHDDQPSFGTTRADLYDGEVFYVDKQIGQLFDALKSKGWWDKAAIIVTSDHGEGIGLETDHGFNYHGFSLYDSETRVPFLMRAPGMVPRVVEQCVALMDLTPTLLVLGGAEIPSDMHGFSLIPYAFGAKKKRPPFLMHLPEADAWEALVDWPFKLIWEKKPNRYSLFNLQTDPHEQTDLIEKDRSLSSRLKDMLQLKRFEIESEKSPKLQQ